MAAPERPPSLLTRRPIETPTLVFGGLAALSAHVLVPMAVVFSQWLLVQLGLAIPVEERKREVPHEVIAAEFVRLGKPFDPTKLPSRKVPPVAKRKPDGVVVSPDAKEQPQKPEDKKKEKQPDTQASLLDNLVDRTRDFAEDVNHEQEGDPNGLAEGTATTAREGDLYLGQLTLFFRRNWTIPNVVQGAEKMVAIAAVSVANDGHLKKVEIEKGSGDPLFDQSILDAVDALIQSGAAIPEPPAALTQNYYGTTLSVRFRGSDVR
jgi:outer membrane biosynthesis protein TonB